jgi:hypothetical protein
VVSLAGPFDALVLRPFIVVLQNGFLLVRLDHGLSRISPPLKER